MLGGEGLLSVRLLFLLYGETVPSWPWMGASMPVKASEDEEEEEEEDEDDEDEDEEDDDGLLLL